MLRLASYHAWVGLSSACPLKRQGVLGQQGSQRKAQKDGEQASGDEGWERAAGRLDGRRKASRLQSSASQTSDRTDTAAFRCTHPPRDMTSFAVPFHGANRSTSESHHALRILANGFSFTQSPRSISSTVLIALRISSAGTETKKGLR